MIEMYYDQDVKRVHDALSMLRGKANLLQLVFLQQEITRQMLDVVRGDTPRLDDG